MNIQSEEITIKEFTTGSTLIFFSTELSAASESFQGQEIIPTIVWLNGLNQPHKVTSFSGNTIWTLNSENYNVQIQEVSDNYITGHSFIRDFNYLIEEQDFEEFKERFEYTIDYTLIIKSLSASSSVTGAEAIPPLHTDYVFKLNHEVDDFYVNVNLKRTFGTLDTLNIYNNLVNSFPSQEANTGVVFGRLMALQNIKDSAGNNIKIPLRNVPIGIFSPSEDYASTSSVDENGDRIFLNTKESSLPIDYFNIESWSADTGDYLRSSSQFTSVPEHYKYITTTNENGEFIIYDAPVGTQIVVFEVDLFKQGLTKDEIALNFFPFPPSNDALLDQIPSFTFKQFPIDVVPAWGTSQTGYTELNITANIDLRKWSTFYIPPMAYQGNKLGSIELLSFSPSLNVDIRDMSKEGFPVSKIPLVEIQNIYDKDEEQTLLWDSEFVQLKKSAKFFTHGFKAFKVRANMYDPYGYRTDSDGVKKIHPSAQGVWLSGYQFKLYYNEPNSIFRTTGFQRTFGFDSPSWRGRDGFHLNRGENSPKTNIDAANQTYPPYDKPWNHLYPEPYKIPEKPKIKNFNRSLPNPNPTRLPGSNPYYLEQPEYKDGDLIGLKINASSVLNDGSGGFGVQRSTTNNLWFSNRFSKEVTSGYVYKYEAGVAFDETYANGYQPSNPAYPIQPGISKVVNGEKYQRVECGYGYWLRPEGWPPVSAEPWGDTIYSQSTRPGFGLTVGFEPSILTVGQDNGNIKVQAQNVPIDVYNFEDKDLALALDSKATYGEGGLNIYRIIDPKERIPQGPTVTPTSATFRFQDFYFQRGPNNALDELGIIGQKIRTGHITSSGDGDDNFFSKLIGGSPHAQFGYNLLQFEITNNGNISVTIPGTSVTIQPGGSATFSMTELPLQGAILTLPGNSNFDFVTSKYLSANYTMKFKNILCKKSDGSNFLLSANNIPQERIIANTNVPADTTPPNYYLITRYGDVRTQWNNNSEQCSPSSSNFDDAVVLFPGNWTNSVKMNGALFQVPNTSGGGYIIDMRFWDDPISTTCGASSFGSGKFRIPIEVV